MHWRNRLIHTINHPVSEIVSHDANSIGMSNLLHVFAYGTLEKNLQYLAQTADWSSWFWTPWNANSDLNSYSPSGFGAAVILSPPQQSCTGPVRVVMYRWELNGASCLPPSFDGVYLWGARQQCGCVCLTQLQDCQDHQWLAYKSTATQFHLQMKDAHPSLPGSFWPSPHTARDPGVLKLGADCKYWQDCNCMNQICSHGLKSASATTTATR